MKAKAGFFLGFLLLAAGAVHAQQQTTLTLDEVIMQAGKAVEDTLTKGTKLAVLSFSSPSEEFSDYVIEELTGILVMNRKVTVIERRSLDLIRKEMNLQLSGDVSDDSAQAIGKQLGAQGIVTGTLQKVGSYYRFRVKVINVETAGIDVQVSRNLRVDEDVASLLGVAPPLASGAAPAVTPVATPAPAPALKPTPAPAPAPAQTRPGLYVGAAFQGAMDLLDAIDWIILNAKNDGNYSIVLGKDEKVPYIHLDFKGLKVTISLKSLGEERKVAYASNEPPFSLFTILPGVTFILEDKVTLVGVQNKPSRCLITVDGGTFIMKGGTIRDNKRLFDYWDAATKQDMTSGGGGVRVNSGAFIMNGGTISGNASKSGGGVTIYSGTFTMNNGTITGNSGFWGGGVDVNGKDTLFTMNGGTIAGNSAQWGGGVYYHVANGAVFNKTGNGGIIYGSDAPEGQANKSKSGRGHAIFGYLSDSEERNRNSTARVTTPLDSTKAGLAGGWE